MSSATDYDTSALAHEDEGYHKGLKPRQLQMIAIGGAIGTGLFMGAGGRLNSAGPGLFIVYAVCGLFVFFILRALGELVLHRPSSGSFVSYAREFLGEKAAYVAGWMYFFNWACTSIVDVTAIALYMHYWGAFGAIPQWTIALIALVIVFTVNMISVKLFGEMEFWAALIKVVALVTFLVVGIIFLTGRFTIDGQTTGVSVIADNGGILPTGILQLVIITSGVIFAYAAVELVGTAAGETENPAKVMPRAMSWGTIVICQIQLYRWSKRGILQRPSFQLLGTPDTSYATLVFLVAVTGLMCYENYWNLVALLVIVPALIVGWYAVRGRVLEMARERVGYTGNYPVIAETPLMDEFLEKDNEPKD
jgi:L-asparagine permease